MVQVFRFSTKKTLSELIAALSCLDINDVMRFEEMFDRQYHALSHMYDALSEPSVFLGLIVLNALVCYQLSCGGEDYWWEFSEHFSSKPPHLSDATHRLIEFVSTSRCNGRLRDQKKRRIVRAQDYVWKRCASPDSLIGEQLEFIRGLAGNLRTSMRAKTIAFAAKILNYGLRIITKKRIPAPQEIDIPLDSRIIKISRALGIRNPVLFWREVAREIGIPPLHIDSILWVGYRLVSTPQKNIGGNMDIVLRILRNVLAQHA